MRLRSLHQFGALLSCEEDLRTSIRVLGTSSSSPQKEFPFLRIARLEPNPTERGICNIKACRP